MTWEFNGATDHAASAGLSLADELPLLAEAKLAAPRPRTGMVERARITRTLEVGADAALTLVAAPAGYGKTTAVRAWCTSSETALAWVTLDAGDNDPARLWTYIATAVDRIRDGLGRRALHRLRVPGVPIRIVVDELMNAIAGFGGRLALVLDDVQTVTDRDCLASIHYAIEHMPAAARLILITRADPALELARLRGRGAMRELRASELAFTPAEAHELLVERAGLDLHDSELAVLLHRTEGWPAVLYLAALWLRTVRDPHRAVRDFGGDERFVAEYLGHEVLAALNPDERALLLHVAVLGSFTAELCDAVLGRSDSRAVLASLEQSNMFVVRLERDWFRVHPLFAQFAVAQLVSVEPGAAMEIHRRAARWLRSRGQMVQAIEHAAAAGDHEVVVALLSEHHLTLLRSGRASLLLRWVRRLPEDCVLAHPEMAVLAAAAATLVGGLGLERRRFLALAARAQAAGRERFGTYADAVMETVRAAAIDGDVHEAVQQGRRAVEVAQAGADEVLVGALASLSRALYLAGELDQAWSVASRALEHPDAERRPPAYAMARSTLALVAADRGWLTSARSHADQARAIVGTITSSRGWLGANAAMAAGAVLAAHGDFAGAEREFAHAERSVADEVATAHHAWVLVRLADVRARRGRLDDAEATLRRAGEMIAQLTDGGVLPAHARSVARDLQQTRHQAGTGAVLDVPSDAQLAVLRLLGTDMSAREIAGELFLSPNTVKSHMRAIYRKLGVGSRADAVARADALNLLGAEPTTAG